MINKERLISSFIELVQIPSESGNEAAISEYLQTRLTALGLELIVDAKSAEVAGMKTGNLIARMKANKAGIPPILFAPHMDTVKPGNGIKPALKDGMICSSGDTILGGDDKAGIAVALELIHHVVEENQPHGELEFLFTFGEEMGLFGSRNLSTDLIHAKMGYVLDGGGEPGTIANNAAAQDSFEAVIWGKAAHAGQRPEQGVSAIQVAARAIDRMKLSRIDYETVANIGMISGGNATNIVCDKLFMKGEARSLSLEKLELETAHIKKTLEEACEEYGARLEFKSWRLFPSFKVEESEAVVRLAKAAAVKAGFEPKVISITGGTDGNFLNEKGIQAVALSVGPVKAHTTDEYIKVDDLYGAAKFVASILDEAQLLW